MALWAGLGQAATVAQLVGVDAGGLISLITQAALTARQNKKACEQLSRRVHMIADLLPHLQEPELMRRPEFRRPLAGLGDTLREAHDLVMVCQRKSRFYRFLNARRLADKFRDIQSRMDSYLLVVPFISYIALTYNLNRICDSLRPSHTTLQSPASTSQSHPVPAWKGVAKFTLAEIAAASNSYAFFTKVCKGTSGTVYRGRLSDGSDVAIKRISKTAQDREKVLRTELAVIPHPRHSHFVRLLGWCEEEDERLVVTEYMRNGWLHDHLHGRKPPSSAVMVSWNTRVEVLLGASRAIRYLHCNFEPSVINCNIKSSNILLNASWMPRVSDLGSSVRHETDEAEYQVVGKGGYIDPEYCRTGRLTPATDVYSFGVVMLEAGELEKLLDGRPEPQPTPVQLQALQWVANTAAQCLHRQSIVRPHISDVVAHLDIAFRLAST
ncbi:putative serine/threonine-protein kinase-like protein CCR3 [Triticum dicoccoides]|uniref:putative serine/threonine-protein kinase-like protein CCR3 n=1 Tax=Triticum dicoccoides TaxID=85692 RepID=UPI00189100A9|nr:putative serine/threonine-protein kinase-like protein CCR3 [Triticum dicoccoides]